MRSDGRNSQLYFSFAIGGRNVFTTYPDEIPIARHAGGRHIEYSPYGFNSAYYYARLGYLCVASYQQANASPQNDKRS